MITYLVGHDDSKWLSKRTTWTFKDAVEAANSGDEIEIAANYNPINEEGLTTIEINKDLNIVGNPYETEENILYNSLGSFVILNGARVTFKNVAFHSLYETRNLLKVQNKSTLELENVLIYYNGEKSKVGNIIHVSDASRLKIFNLVTHQVDGNLYDLIVIDNSTASIEKATIVNDVRVLNNSNVTVLNTRVEVADTTAFFIKKSKVNFENCIIKGGGVSGESHYASIRFIDNSDITIGRTDVIQTHFSPKSPIVYALESVNSEFKVEESTIDSLVALGSQGFLFSSRIKDILSVRNKTYLELESLAIYGRSDRSVNIHLLGHSSLKADTVFIGKQSIPDIKIEYNCVFEVEEVVGIQYDAKLDILTETDDGEYIYRDIDYKQTYFGEKTASMKLKELTGYRHVENQLDALVAIAKMNKIRSSEDENYKALSLHMSLSGDNGTGKKTFAKLFTQHLHEAGLIENDNLVTLTQLDMIGGSLEAQITNMKEIFTSALGGVLLVHKADIIFENSGILNEALRFFNENKNKFIVMLTGEPKNLENLKQDNDYLKTIVPNTINFSPYTTQELIELGYGDLVDNKYTIDKDKYTEMIQNNYEKNYNNNNMHWIKDLNEQLIRKLAMKLLNDGTADKNRISDDLISSLYII